MAEVMNFYTGDLADIEARRKEPDNDERIVMQKFIDQGPNSGQQGK